MLDSKNIITFENTREVTLDSLQWDREWFEARIQKLLKEDAVGDIACKHKQMIQVKVYCDGFTIFESELLEKVEVIYHLYPMEAALFCNRLDLLKQLKEKGCRLSHRRWKPSMSFSKVHDWSQGENDWSDGSRYHNIFYKDTDILENAYCDTLRREEKESDYLELLKEEWNHVSVSAKKEFKDAFLYRLSCLTNEGYMKE